MSKQKQVETNTKLDKHNASAFIHTLTGPVRFNIPSTWRAVSISEFVQTQKPPVVEELLEKALQNPRNARALQLRLKTTDAVAILAEDLTRNSPKQPILRYLLNHLTDLGIGPAQIRIVIALGTHRALSRKELEEGYGEDVVSRFEVLNHDCRSADLVPIGKLSSGRVVKINREVFAASFRIGIGSIFPHPLNGFGGGGKILFPGVADYDSIFEHHLRYSFVGNSQLGSTEQNQFYQSVNALALAGKLDFIINSVLDHQDQLYEIVAGDPMAAHLAGIEICRTVTGKRFNQKADLTIISAFPYAEGPQIVKPLAAASMITRRGGVIILAADCRVPLPEIYFSGCERFRHKHDGMLAKAVLESFARNQPLVDHTRPELNMSLAQVLLTLNDFKVILVTKDIPKSAIAQLGFIPAETMDHAIRISNDFLTNPLVHIVPAGGVFLPLCDPNRNG